MLPYKKLVKIGTEQLTVYSIGWLARAVDRNVHTVRQWEAKGILPRPLINLELTPSSKDKSVGTTRWYLAAEIAGYASAFRKAKVRRGISIESSPFKRSAALIRADLKKAMQKNIKAFPKKLSNEAQIQAGWETKTDGKLDKEMKAILDLK